MVNQNSQKSFNNLIHNYLKYMENIKSASPQTLRAYQSDLCQCFGQVKNTIFCEKSAIFQTHQAQIKWSKLDFSSQNRKIATIKSFYKFLLQEQYTHKDLSINLHCPRPTKKVPHFISVDEALSIVSYLRSEKSSPLEKVFFSLLYGAGLRVSEACCVELKNINLKTNSLVIKGKGNYERVVILPTFANRQLNEFLQPADKSNKYLFGEKAFPTRKAYQIIKDLGQKVGLIVPLHPHALRHSFATHLLSSGSDLRSLQDLLGHQSLQTTEKYTHIQIDQLARTMENMHPLGRKISK